MTPIRQRRRNRHKAKAVKRQQHQSLRLYFTLGIDTSRVNKAFAQVQNAMDMLSETMSSPEFQMMMNKAWQAFASIPSQTFRARTVIARTGIAVNQSDIDETQSIPTEVVRHIKGGYLGDPSCKFNARSPLLQCAVNPKGDCGECGFYES